MPLAKREIEPKLIEFARWVIDQLNRSEDLDSSDLEEKLEDLGLIVGVEVHEPCSEFCRCAEFVDEWPATCKRVAPGVLL